MVLKQGEWPEILRKLGGPAAKARRRQDRTATQAIVNADALSGLESGIATVDGRVDVLEADHVGEAPEDGTPYAREDGAWVEIPAGGGGSSVSTSDTAPTPTDGALWWDSDEGNLYVGYDDGDSTQWVPGSIPGALPAHTHAQADVTGLTTDLALKAPLASPTFTGTLAAPTVQVGTTDNSSTGGGFRLYKRGTGFSEGIYFSDGAGGNRGVIGMDPSHGFYFRAGDTTTSDVTIDTGGGVIAQGSITGTSVNGGAAPSGTGANDGSRMQSGLVSTSRTVTTNIAHHAFYNPNGTVGTITTTASATAYNTSSDEVLKDFIGLYDPVSAIEVIRADPVRDFTWKADGSYAVGWGAQTSYNVSQDLATPPPPRSPEDMQTEGPGTDPKEPGYIPWGMDQARRTPYLWAALSWALDEIEALKARVEALEAG